MAKKILLTLSTFPDAETARRISTQLITEKFAACANVLPGVESIYRWKEKVEDTAEWVLLIKSRRDLFAALRAEIQKLHTYDVPEVIALPVVEGSDAYLGWIDRELTAPGE